MSDAQPISLNQQLQGVLEVLNNRRAGYPKQVARGKLRQAEADYKIRQIEAVCDTLLLLVRAETAAGAGPGSDFDPRGKAEIERVARDIIERSRKSGPARS